MSRSKLILAFAFTFAVASPAIATAGPGTGAEKTDKTVKKPQKQRISEADLSTLQHHHDVNLMEIEMGKLAEERGGPAVKKYGAALVKDHQTADKTAIALAKARGVTLSAHATPMNGVEEAQHQKQMETMKRLETLEGSDFDREFLTAMVDGHSAELGYLTVAIADASDAKLKAHLEKVRPVIEKHADQARDLLAQMNDDTAAPKSDEATPSKQAPAPARPTPSKQAPTNPSTTPR